jgi:hypothetical protein
VAKLEKVFGLLLILVSIIIGVIALNFIIKYFFIVLGFCFNNPKETIIATILIGISLISLPIGKEDK